MKTHDWSLFLLPVAAIAAPAHATDYMTIEQAQTLLFPAATSFTENELKLSENQQDRIKEESGLRQRWDTQKVWRANRKGELDGWLILDEVIGKHEFITYATAISPQGEVLGIEVLSYRETHGGQIRDQSWRKHFTGKTLADPFKLNKDVPNISGATLSCRNVLDGVKRVLTIHKLYLSKI